MGPLLTIFGRRMAARQLSDEEGISMFKAVRAIREAENKTPAELSVASGCSPSYFNKGLYFAAAMDAGWADGPLPPDVVDAGVGVGSALFDGKIIEWLLDPANQERLMAFIKFIMTIAVLFI